MSKSSITDWAMRRYNELRAISNVGFENGDAPWLAKRLRKKYRSKLSSFTQKLLNEINPI